MERDVEARLGREVRSRGGVVVKLSGGRVGMVDRVVVVAGRVWFVELKENSSVSPAQRHAMALLDAAGAAVRVVRGDAGVDEFLKEVDNAVGQGV